MTMPEPYMQPLIEAIQEWTVRARAEREKLEELRVHFHRQVTRTSDAESFLEVAWAAFDAAVAAQHGLLRPGADEAAASGPIPEEADKDTLLRASLVLRRAELERSASQPQCSRTTLAFGERIRCLMAPDHHGVPMPHQALDRMGNVVRWEDPSP